MEHHTACKLNESFDANGVLHSQAEAGREVVAEVLGTHDRYIYTLQVSGLYSP